MAETIPDIREHVMDQILHPRREDADQILEDLELAGFPTRDKVHQEIEAKLLLPPDRIPEHWLPTYQITWQPEISIQSLLTLEPSPPPTSLTFLRAGLEGRVIGYAETPNAPVSTALTSTSMDRAPAPVANFVRGKSGYVPFKPGGLDDVILAAKQTTAEPIKGLRTIPPGFSRGLRLPGDDPEDEAFASLGDTGGANEDKPIDESHVMDEERDFLPNGDSFGEIDELLPTTRTHLRPSKAPRRTRRPNVVKRDWAHVVDINKPMTNFHELVPDMAHKYPFELDTFQKEAVYHLEMGDSVFVAAHTSAGKTVLSSSAIYTSPIKALSNQKFRDFKQTFSSSSVGILTGDVQINPEASCLVMTTEILRSMLYKGADLIRDVEFVIFDEVHYVNDAERGVVWEEVIIMLPDHVNIILLSATVPNSKEFADWVGRTKKKDIYVISTAQRPVPLEYYLYAGRDMFKIVDASRKWVSRGYQDAGDALKRKQDKERDAAGLPPVQRVGARGAARGVQRGAAPARGGQRGAAPNGSAPRGRGGGQSRIIHTGTDKNLYVHLLNHLQKKGLLPVVVFTLSKKRCEENASTLTNADLCTSVEKSEVHVAVEKALSRLKGSDKKLPQITRMRDLLSRGIGVHHGGLLPIVKEVVEILFARGLVKILFATETFAMGVNMPARCVVFSNIRKHDGRSFRDILPGEYTQMAGRAGRRGLDPTGTVIIVANDKLPEQSSLMNMMLGTPGKLQSQFRLTYNMILNLLRVEALRVEEMIKRSFSENSSQRLLPEHQKQVAEHERTLSKMPKLECDVCLGDIEHYYDLSLQVVGLNIKLCTMVTSSPSNANLFGSGRVVILRDGHFKRGNVGILLKPDPRQASSFAGKLFFVLAMVDQETKLGDKDVDDRALPPRWPLGPASLEVENLTYDLRSVPLDSISMVTSETMKVDATGIVDHHKKSLMLEIINSLQFLVQNWRSAGTIPEVIWDRIRTLDFQEALRRRNDLAKRRQSLSCTLCGDFDDHYLILHGQKTLRANIDKLKMAISDQNLDLIPDYEQRIEVLKELKFIDENSTIQLKGRVACEINSANELIVTELILENTLANYEPEEVVALLSCFVFQEKTEVEPAVPIKLEEGRDAILAISNRVGGVQDRHKVSTEGLRSSLKFGLMEVVHEWAKGMPFDQITALTDVPEGTIVRVITRLDETCREVRDAARVIGDMDLFKKLEEAQVKIKRDIVFAASLYF
ncbi:ATP-dependent RNA helicase [Suillus paluster]|uniref:ATP-dependent RNA helicase n=1 Tax=Suillus paluster TaxID=48578 RepID=UPI001B86293B|nr:ATP-dependent RNA helicase [Suillus paluster]KAG1754810.1 ATP-dependent RNA helicase [Suillus paluster]